MIVKFKVVGVYNYLIVHTGVMNTKVAVTFNSDVTTATCKFLQFQQQHDNTYYYCTISYEPIKHNHNQQQMIFGTSQNHTVVVNFPHAWDSTRWLSFTVNVTDGLNTTFIVGTFNIRKSKLQNESLFIHLV